MKLAVLYVRFSPRRNADKSVSIDAQLKACHSYCNAQGYDVLNYYVDREKSGKNMDRDALKMALDVCCDNKAVLVVYSLSRLARNTVDAVRISNQLNDCGADLASIKEAIDTAGPMGRFMFRLMASLAELEREQTSERTKDAMRSAQADGRRMGRVDRLPFGWKIDPDDQGLMVADSNEQKIVERIVKMYECGLSDYKIAKSLGREGIPCRGRGSWYQTTVRKILVREGAINP